MTLTTLVYAPAPTRGDLDDAGVNPGSVKHDCWGGLTEDITLIIETTPVNEDPIVAMLRKRLPRVQLEVRYGVGEISVLYDPMPDASTLANYGIDRNALSFIAAGGNVMPPKVMIELDEEHAPNLIRALGDYAPGVLVYEAESDSVTVMDDAVWVKSGAIIGF
ncbi:hypothetical protein ACFL0V_00660 [Nanoarchaeota archaeon]